ncbi:2,3-diaminopropionate biosynthesis protein SbnA [Glaciibacter superstes]|uniref:2,3-diaminopropionate biosynthesis protein SbnA n=1 Tax=Glaciibacter superstes TaxID=501023 RepID=UPI0003B7B955|nr:2,3-diaminopropionate biosynthesis protein SbnA [Glaciibacter superstes]
MATIVSNPLDFNVRDLYVDLAEITGRRLLLKCEGFNFAGSIKLKAAMEIVESMERTSRLAPGQTIVESSSGNMGIALSMAAAYKGYHFVCVTDVRCTKGAEKAMAALGAEVHIVRTADSVRGFLGARLDQVSDLCRDNDDYVWLNQYSNPSNWEAHYRTTGPQIAKAIPDLQVLFVGAGTTGTLMGCARYFRAERPSVKIVAVDTVGSVTFGTPAAPRLIPGLGTSVVPGIFDESFVDDVIHVREARSIEMCRSLASHGFLFGGSTGTVVRGAIDWLEASQFDASVISAAIAPDMGWNYTDTIYDDEWRDSSFPAEAEAAYANTCSEEHAKAHDEPGIYAGR